jgi:hypothetical protein
VAAADGFTVRLDERGIDVEFTTGNTERFRLRVDDTERRGVALVVTTETDRRQLRFLSVGIRVARNVHERQRTNNVARLSKHLDDRLTLEVVIDQLCSFVKSQHF